MERNQGIQQGLDIGGNKALAKTAVWLLTKKFYMVSEEISKLDTITLEFLIDGIWDVQTVEKIKKYYL